MKYKTDLSKAARKEIKDQAYYYESLVPGLGKRFHHNVRQQLKTLAVNPHFQIRYARIRCIPVPEFPFMMHYSLNEDDRSILVHSVMHTSRNPVAHWNSGDWQVNEDAPVYGMMKYDMEFVYAGV
jgi:hypothetical protein